MDTSALEDLKIWAIGIIIRGQMKIRISLEDDADPVNAGRYRTTQIWNIWEIINRLLMAALEGPKMPTGDVNSFE